MDTNKTKHENIYAEDFAMAKKILAGLPGCLEWVKAAYQAFRYRENDVCLIFYPHKTSAGNYHVRVRDQNSRDSKRADFLMRKLYCESGNDCTFSRKIR